MCVLAVLAYDYRYMCAYWLYWANGYGRCVYIGCTGLMATGRCVRIGCTGLMATGRCVPIGCTGLMTTGRCVRIGCTGLMAIGRCVHIGCTLLVGRFSVYKRRGISCFAKCLQLICVSCASLANYLNLSCLQTMSPVTT